MGTRNLTAVFVDGEYKVAQYGQWDGYPGGQGLRILNILKNISKTKLKRQLKKIRFIDNEKDKKFIESYEANAPEWSYDPDYRTEEQKRWFLLYVSRDLGGKILQSIIDSKDDEILLFNKIDFAGDSLFCEFAYVIDLDKNTFEVYEGFNKKPINKNERFYGVKQTDPKYFPVKIIYSFDLDSLPDDEEFLSVLNQKTEEV